jgi:uncharacterized protein YfdQ (DUF2303 family)
MEKEAILHIGAMAHSKEFLAHISSISKDRPFALVPESLQVTDMEKYLSAPVRFRNNFATYRISEFTRYCVDFDTDTSQCIIFADELSFRSNPHAITVFDKGGPESPMHGGHRAEVKLQKLPEYEHAIDFDGRSFGQKELAEWIEEFADNLEIFTSDGQVMEVPLAARAIRELSIKAARQTTSAVHDMAESRSISESIEAENSESKPASIKFTFSPYPGFEEYTVEFRLSILTSAETPKFKPRMLRQDRLIQAIADEFTEKVTSGLKDTKIKWYLGA